MSYKITYGTIVGIHPDSSDIVIVSDGIFTVECYNPHDYTVFIGQSFSIYKQNSTYYLGNKIAV